ncbi:MAG TPA: acyl-CoA dehydrogenase family protein [Acidimicrobiales bacterium]|nr:acyl-CoA dehydrogenase family protein [Acidimicrobiales bacterium]
MLLELTADQQSLRDTTAKFLSDSVPVDQLRELRQHPAGYEEEYWRQGAELGWTSLLVSEEAGGGSVSGHGLVDATLLAYELGRHAAPGPFLSCNVVAAALSAEDPVRHDAALKEVLEGSVVASWCFTEARPHGHLPEGTTLEMRVDGDEVVLGGTKRPVESAAQAGHLLVTGRTGEGLTQVLVPAGTPGMSLKPMHSVDLTRRFWVAHFDRARVPLDAVVGEVGGAHEQVERQLQQALVLAGAESVGAMQAAFDMTVSWAFDRYSFGRPLASYQELKHRFADMKTWLEASHAIADTAAAAVDADQTDAAELVSVASAYIGEYGADLLQDCVQMHGGIGVTYEHDLHLFLRRVTLNRALFGTPADHRRRVATLLAEREEVR